MAKAILIMVLLSLLAAPKEYLVTQPSDTRLEAACVEVGINHDNFINLASQYQIDPTYALSRMILETGWGTSQLWIKYNNPAGITCGKAYCHYNSPEEGLEAMIALMARYAYEWDLKTVEEQSDLWSEADDAGKVKAIMEKLK